MKQILFIVILLLSTVESFACDCDPPNPGFEFQDAIYVFEGKVSKKAYSLDKQTFTITFDIIKHYKDGEKPKSLDFKLSSEAIFTNIRTSCDWSIGENETWLIYVKKRKGILTFSYNCSNSRQIDKRLITEREQKMLDIGNEFNPDDFVSFNNAKPAVNIDSIFKTGKIKDYENSRTHLNVMIDKDGNLIQAVPKRISKYKFDELYLLPIGLSINETALLTEFEKDALELVSKIKKWKISGYGNTKYTQSQIFNMSVKFDLELKKWTYFLFD